MSVMAGGRESSSARQRDRALAFLVSSAWLAEEATARRIVISDQEVQRLVAGKQAAAGGAAEFRGFLEASGETAGDVRFEARRELAAAKLRRTIRESARLIGAGQIADYYTQHKGLFVIPEQRRAMIETRTGRVAIERVKRRVEAGASLISAGERKVGEGWITVSSPPGHRGPLERAIYAARVNTLTGPVKEDVDYSLFEIKHITPGRQQTLPEVRERIRRKLSAERQQRALAEFARQWQSRWSARTSCRAGYVIPGCRQYKGRLTSENPFNPS
jgi:foldase protein PrsA